VNAIIMAGGEGTRLKSITGDLPKPMVNLCGKPILEHILRLLVKNGVKEACITLRYRPEVIRNYFGDGERFGIKLHYHTEDTPLGTAGGVRACEEFYGDRDFLVISGDCACDFDLQPLMEAHLRHRPAVTMALYAHEQPLQYGIVLTDRTHRVVSFIEKPAWDHVVSDLVNTGIYVVSPAAMKYVPTDKPFDFSKDLFPRLMELQHDILGLPMEGYWCDIGTPRSYHQCAVDALDGKLKLEGVISEPVPKSDDAPQRVAGIFREYRCRNRARLMRLMSQTLMEAGADFSDGISVMDGSGRVRIAPDAASDRLIISAQDIDPAQSCRLAETYLRIARDLDRP